MENYKMGSKNSPQSSLRIDLILVLVLVSGGLYINSIGNLFTNWDDSMIYGNAQIRSLDWENIHNMFTPARGINYQPIRVLSYAIDYHFWKLNPVGYHLTSIFFYILTCLMVFLSLRSLSANLRENAPSDSHERVALFGSLLFAAHPVHVEAVTWLAARKEVLQGFFFFSGLYLYLKAGEKAGRPKMIYMGLVLVAITMAILSKPSAVVFPGVVIVYEIARRKEKLLHFIKGHYLFLIISLMITSVFTFLLMKGMIEAGGVKPYYGDSFLKNSLVCIYVFLRSIKLLIVTLNYSAAYSFAVTLPIFHTKNILYAFTVILLLGLSIFSLRWTKVIFFSFFFFTLSILPYLNIIPISTLIADRYVFIASFSYIFLLGLLYDRLYVFRHEKLSEGFFKLLSISLFLFLLIAYSSITIQRNKVWENSFTLWADAVEKHPDSNTANALMGVVYMELGMDEKAVEYLEKAIQILPYDYLSRNNLGIIYGRLDKPEKALEELMTALRLRPDNDAVKINLSVFFQRQKEFGKAEEVLKHLLTKSPQNPQLHYRLGLIYRDAGHYELAISEILKSMELAPNIITIYEELGNIYASRLKDFEKAKYYYGRGIEAAPHAKPKVEDLRWMVQDLEAHR
jgi:tetratricopeptide (TPR) repeat protein